MHAWLFFFQVMGVWFSPFIPNIRNLKYEDGSKVLKTKSTEIVFFFFGKERIKTKKLYTEKNVSCSKRGAPVAKW